MKEELGLVVSALGDSGPIPLASESSLSEQGVLQLSTLGMILISMGNEPIPYRLYGPFPVPGSPEFEAFGLNFFVSATETSDKRVEIQGRNSNLWVVFNPELREILLALHNEIETVLIDKTKQIKQEIELTNQGVLKNILDEIQEVISKKDISIPQKIEAVPPHEVPTQAIFFYTVNPQGELVPVTADNQVNLRSYAVLVIVNTVVERIFILKNREDAPARLMFLASRAASQLNAEHWKNKFYISDITDPLECERLTGQAEILFRNIKLLASPNRISKIDAGGSAKIIIVGLAESGKTTIVKVITEGYKPDKNAKYKATKNYVRKKTTFLGRQLTLFDLGGQEAFLDRFTGDLAEFIFSNVQTLLFVIDIANIGELSRAKYYFNLIMQILGRYSPTAPVFVLLHKMDLISKDKAEEVTKRMKAYLTTDIQYPLTFCDTSVFSESIFNAFKIIINNLKDQRESIGTILDKFVKRNSSTLSMAQFLTADGTPLFSTSNFTHSTVSQIKETLDTLLHCLTDKKKDTTSLALLESENTVSFVRFFENGSVLFLCFSRKGMIESNENTLALYEEVSLVSRKLHLATGGSLEQY